MYEIKKNIGKVVTSKFVGTVPSFYTKRICRAAVSQRLRNTALRYGEYPVTLHFIAGYFTSLLQFNQTHLLAFSTVGVYPEVTKIYRKVL